MTNLPNPWLTDHPPRSAEAAVASIAHVPTCDATADHFVEPNPVTAAFQDGETYQSDIGDVHEIFYHARRLINEQSQEISLATLRLRGFDEIAFMDAIEPPPLFLQRRA